GPTDCQAPPTSVIANEAQGRVASSRSWASSGSSGPSPSAPRANELGPQLLPYLADLSPGVLFDPFFQIKHREIIAAAGAGEPFPGDRGGHRRTRPGTRRIGRDRRRFARVAEVVDEDVAPAQGLGHLGEIELRIVGAHPRGDPAGKLLGGLPI